MRSMLVALVVATTVGLGAAAPPPANPADVLQEKDIQVGAFSYRETPDGCARTAASLQAISRDPALPGAPSGYELYFTAQSWNQCNGETTFSLGLGRYLTPDEF